MQDSVGVRLRELRRKKKDNWVGTVESRAFYGFNSEALSSEIRSDEDDGMGIKRVFAVVVGSSESNQLFEDCVTFR